MAAAGMASSRARACAQFARTWISGSPRASTRAGMAPSGMAVAFIQPADATLRTSPQASLRPTANASAVSGGWILAMARMACSRTPTSPVLAAWSKGPPATAAAVPSLPRASAA